MEDKLVTLSTRTFERAQKIKDELEKNHIETQLQTLHFDNSKVSVGVRVKIKESDLPHAISIVEKIESGWEKTKSRKSTQKSGTLLLPIDLNDNIKEVTKYGFFFAKKLQLNVVFLHVYYKSQYKISSNKKINIYELPDGETFRRNMMMMNAEIDNMKNLISQWIANNEVEDVHFSFELKPGVPEDVILEYSRKENPHLIIMGTKAKTSQKTDDFVGSVTSEVLESSSVPVITLPVNGEIKQPCDVKKISILTNFDENDLIAIDEVLSLYKNSGLEVFFIHTSVNKDKWDEVMLSGIKTYFSEHYPDIKTEYALLKHKENLEQIKEYLRNNSIDLIALNTKKRNLFARFLNQGIATRLLFNVNTPLLVMHL